MALPGNGTIPAVESRRILLAKHTGMKIMELVEKCVQDLLPVAGRAKERDPRCWEISWRGLS